MSDKPTTNKGGVWQKLLDTLSQNVGAPVPRQALGGRETAQRVDELRAEGWDIVPDAEEKAYVLRSPEKGTEIQIDRKLRYKVLERDNYTCQICGHRLHDSYTDGESISLEVDYILPPSLKGRIVEENLYTICRRCNAGKKSLMAAPETLKNRIVTLHLPDRVRETLSKKAKKEGRTITSLILRILEENLD